MYMHAHRQNIHAHKTNLNALLLSPQQQLRSILQWKVFVCVLLNILNEWKLIPNLDSTKVDATVNKKDSWLKNNPNKAQNVA